MPFRTSAPPDRQPRDHGIGVAVHRFTRSASPQSRCGCGNNRQVGVRDLPIPMAAFVDAAPDLNVANVRHIDWADRTDNGLVTIDESVYPCRSL